MTRMLREAVTTLVMHADNRRVLMAKRSSIGAFANARVFPGGVIDEGDRSPERAAQYSGLERLDEEERTRRIAAARELREETGVVLDDLSQMQLISRWVTPEMVPTRFDTWFYILQMPHGQIPVADGHELTSLEWVDPRLVVTENFEVREEECADLIFPTLAHLVQLASVGTGWRDLATQLPYPSSPIKPLVTEIGGKNYVSISTEFGFKLTTGPVVR